VAEIKGAYLEAKLKSKITGNDLLEWLQSLSPEQLALEVQLHDIDRGEWYWPTAGGLGVCIEDDRHPSNQVIEVYYNYKEKS
jgi:hypothetical protein